MKMAFLNNRNYIGVDMSPEYCEMAQQRLNKCDTRRNQYYKKRKINGKQ